MEIGLRPAIESDVPHLARILQMAGGGLMDAIYHDLVPGRSVAETMEHRFLDEASYTHYRKNTVATAGSEIAGGVNLHAMDDPTVHWTDPMVPQSRRLVMEPFGHLEAADGLYVNFIGVYPAYRSKGAGRLLLAFAISEARRMGLPAVHLHVFEANAGAVRLYRSLGFGIVKRHPLVPHEMMQYGGDMLLMSCAV